MEATGLEVFTLTVPSSHSFLALVVTVKTPLAIRMGMRFRPCLKSSFSGPFGVEDLSGKQNLMFPDLMILPTLHIEEACRTITLTVENLSDMSNFEYFMFVSCTGIIWHFLQESHFQTACMLHCICLTLFFPFLCSSMTLRGRQVKFFEDSNISPFQCKTIHRVNKRHKVLLGKKAESITQ